MQRDWIFFGTLTPLTDWKSLPKKSKAQVCERMYQVIPSFLAIGWTSFRTQWTKRNYLVFRLPRLKSLAGHKTRLSMSPQGQLWYPLVLAAPWTNAIKRKQTRGFLSTFFMHWTRESRISWYLQWIQMSLSYWLAPSMTCLRLKLC